jgi:hypothetical protein
MLEIIVKFKKGKNVFVLLSSTLTHACIELNGVTKGEANGQLPISFEGLPIAIFCY